MMTLDNLFIKFNSDKSSLHHNFSPIYEKLLQSTLHKPLNVLILGIGGYHHIDKGGGDLLAFQEYLPNANIVGVDIYPKTFLNGSRIKTYVANQVDEEALSLLIKENNVPDIIIEDASHICPLSIKTFEILFPLLKNKGYYICEDVHSSYWDEIAIDGTNFGGGMHENTTQNYFKKMTDLLNYEHLRGRFPVQEQFKNMIESIQFFKELIVIQKS